MKVLSAITLMLAVASTTFGVLMAIQPDSTFTICLYTILSAVLVVKALEEV
jgi:hypothetical protein